MNRFMRADTRLFFWLFNFMAKRDCRWVKWVSQTGDGYLYLVLGLLCWIFEPEHGSLFMYTALLAYALELPIYVVLKNALKRQRPCDLIFSLKSHITPSDKFSLPSGHTAAAFLMATLITFFYPALTVFAYGWAATIGLSRVLLGVHYPSDILAGAALGIAFSLLSITILF